MDVFARAARVSIILYRWFMRISELIYTSSEVRCRHDSPRWSELPTPSTQPQQLHMHAIAYSQRTEGQKSAAAALLHCGHRLARQRAESGPMRISEARRSSWWPQSICLDYQFDAQVDPGNGIIGPALLKARLDFLRNDVCRFFSISVIFSIHRGFPKISFGRYLSKK